MAYKNYHRGGKPQPKPHVEVKGDEAVLNLPIEELGLNQPTFDLLKANKINTIIDLARKTEREMFKIQTFSKRHLLDIKPKLNAKGVDFYPMEERPPRPQNSEDGKNQQSVKNPDGAADAANKRQNAARQPNAERQNGRPQDNRDRQNRPRNQQQNGKDGFRDRNNSQNGRENARRDNREARPQPQKNVLLPISEWRKVNKNGKWGFNNGLQTVIEPQFDEVFLFKEELACVEINEQCGFINAEGEIVIPVSYECAMSFSEGLASVVVNGKCGYINKQNEMVIEAKYDAATPFENGRAKVKEDGKWGTIDTLGAIVWNK